MGGAAGHRGVGGRAGCAASGPSPNACRAAWRPSRRSSTGSPTTTSAGASPYPNRPGGRHHRPRVGGRRDAAPHALGLRRQRARRGGCHRQGLQGREGGRVQAPRRRRRRAAELMVLARPLSPSAGPLTGRYRTGIRGTRPPRNGPCRRCRRPSTGSGALVLLDAHASSPKVGEAQPAGPARARPSGSGYPTFRQCCARSRVCVPPPTAQHDPLLAPPWRSPARAYRGKRSGSPPDRSRAGSETRDAHRAFGQPVGLPQTKPTRSVARGPSRRVPRIGDPGALPSPARIRGTASYHQSRRPGRSATRSYPTRAMTAALAEQRNPDAAAIRRPWAPLTS